MRARVGSDGIAAGRRTPGYPDARARDSRRPADERGRSGPHGPDRAHQEGPVRVPPGQVPNAPGREVQGRIASLACRLSLSLARARRVAAAGGRYAPGGGGAVGV